MDHFHSALRKLEFHKIVERIAAFSVSEPAKSLAQRILPLFHKESIEQELHRVTQAKELLLGEGAVPLEGIKDVTISLKKTTVENQVLSARELLEIAQLIRASQTMASFLSKRKSTAPLLLPFVAHLVTDRVLEYNITQAIDEHGNVTDSASKELKAIRSGIVHSSEELRKRLGGILKRISEQEFLQDEIITTRDGRMVIPVKVEYKKQVPGFIHSSSATGATVFIEPAETLELNNALRELQINEQREIERILRQLTGMVAEQRDQLETAFRTMAELDVLFAKAKYSTEIQGNQPTLTLGNAIRLIEARHPVLLQRHKRDQVEPLTFILDDETRTVVITGPNAGGKSVAMKTVGLLAAVAQAGLHIPASVESELPVFQNFFADIGDEQSIENDLSTFSSHLLNLQEILSRADEYSLVLIDEIGTGTDPAEGSALAASVLQELTRRKALTVATTHHGSLKVFAHTAPGMANASMEFDLSTLSPTYRFRIGVPGSSYAFELAERLQFDRHFLDHARSFLATDRLQLERLLVDLERQAQEYSLQLDSVQHERDKYRTLLREYETKLEELRRETKKLKSEAAAQAKDIIDNAQALIERTIKEIRETNAEREVIRHAKGSLSETKKQLESMVAQESEDTDRDELTVGDSVRLKTGTEIGELLERRGHEATVLWGSARLRVRANDLVRAKGKPRTHSSTVVAEEHSARATNEIDLRGLTGEEAISQIEFFLDNALVAGLHRVDIIHGKGTGALRKKVSAFLKSHPHVHSYRLGEWNEGGSGVTVVELT